MPLLRTSLLASLAVILTSSPLTAADSPRSTPEVALETDPATFAFGGYSAHLRLRLPEVEMLRPWTIGVGAYAMTFPQPFRDLALRDAPAGSTLRLRAGGGVFLDRFLTDPDSGLFVGVQAARQRYRLTGGGESDSYSATVVMPRIGYHLELGHGLYALPWAGIGRVWTDDDDRRLGAKEYSVRSWIPFATMHLGYRF